MLQTEHTNNCFIRGLLPPAPSYVVSHRPKGVDEAEQLAKLWEQLQVMDTPRVAAIERVISPSAWRNYPLVLRQSILVREVESSRDYSRSSAQYRPPQRGIQRTPDGRLLCEKCTRVGHTTRVQIRPAVLQMRKERPLPTGLSQQG